MTFTQTSARYISLEGLSSGELLGAGSGVAALQLMQLLKLPYDPLRCKPVGTRSRYARVTATIRLRSQACLRDFSLKPYPNWNSA
jgi:hypothetical protein